MGRIMTMCPTTQRAIPTGLRTNMVVFETLPDVAVPVSCSECGEQHQWRPSRAWVALPYQFSNSSYPTWFPMPADRASESPGTVLLRVGSLK